MRRHGTLSRGTQRNGQELSDSSLVSVGRGLAIPTAADTSAAAQPGREPPPARVAAWLAVLLIPNLLLLLWLFSVTSLLEYLGALYSLDAPALLHLPLAGACLAILAGMTARYWRPQPDVDLSLSVGARRLPLGSVWVPLSAVFLLLAVVIGAGFLRSLFSVVAGVAVVAAGTGAGLFLLELPLFGLASDRFHSPLERFVLAAALGLGVLALAVFVLGTAGVLAAWLWWALIGGLCFFTWPALKRLGSNLGTRAGAFVREAHPVAVGAALFLALWCGAHVLLIWSPPLEYDVLEYHLGAPAQYLRDGRVSFLHENIYATFPENAEMLYLLGMILTGGKWAGLAAGHTILFAAWLLGIAGVYTLTARLTGATGQGSVPESDDARHFVSWHPAQVAATLAALLYALVPYATLLVADFYVEHFQAFFHVAAVLAACAFLCDRRTGVRDRLGWITLCGALAGICCGVKYPALLSTLAPLLVLVPALCALRGSFYEAVHVAGRLGAAAAAVLSPWLLRNLMLSGDPLHPLGLLLKRRLAGGGGAVPDRLDHFDVAHRAGAHSLQALRDALAHVWGRFQPPSEQAEGVGNGFFWLRNAECGPHLLGFALPGLACCARAEVLLVAGIFAADLTVWFVLTHRITRFLYPALPLLAVLGGVGIARLWTLRGLRAPVTAVALAAALLLGPLQALMVWSLSRPGAAAGLEPPQDAARAQYHAIGNSTWYEAWETINALPEGSKVLCLGDAQTFYLDRTPAYSVVFNRSLLEEVMARAGGDAALAVQLLAAHGITHIYVNAPEWFRLDASYALARAGPDGRWQYAKLDARTREDLRWWLGQGMFHSYGETWPAGVYPAYLKLSPESYVTFHQMILEHTDMVWKWPPEERGMACGIFRLRTERLLVPEGPVAPE
jgi:hypothetical protein